MPGMAISGGPSQPEFTSFTPVEVTDMVDLFTGDFQYNIPLLEVEGYPVNLSYATGMGIEDPASCVGFGWTLNAAGVINRAVRGIPDDFSGDEITTETNIKPNWTVGVGIGGSVELIGFDFGEKIKNVNLNEFLKNDLSVKPNLNIGILYNNYTGLGYNASLGASVDAALAGNRVKLGAAGALGIGSESGLGVDGSLSASIDDKKNNSFINVGLTAGIGANTRGGLRQISIGMPITLGTDRFKKQERQVNSTGLSLKAAIPVGYSTYVPQATNAFHSYMISGDIAVGPEGKWSNFKGSINGYYSTQKLSSPQKTTPAYGYLYADKGMNNDGAMHDFNREKDGVYNENIPALPMTQMTYDVYTVSGQGISGMYRPHRDFGTVYDPYVYSSSNGNSIGGDIGIGDVTKVGINFSNTTNFSTTGRWSDGSNGSRNALSFNSQKAEKPDYESVYFKGAGEFSEIDMEYYNKIQQEYPVRMDINKSGRAFPVYKKRTSLINTNESNIDVSNNDRQKREPRNQVFSFLTFDEAEKGGFPVNIYNKDGNPVDQPVAGVDKREKHHIAEITINRPDGMRYIYGSQTYNYKQKEVTFNVAASSTNGSVTYKPGDNSTSNQNGKDNYYNSNTLPPHATAYQLTAIVSADYVDVEGDGLTPDDLGNYTNFTYTQYYNNENPYRWRNPEGGNRANFNDGFLCKKDDNKGTYIYGEKEVKMLRSIETKNYIAQFHYSPRFDAWDVAGENGGMGYNPLHKLDSIRLFSRHDLEKEQQSNKTYTATPIKTVHFTYNYSLCNGIPFYSEDGTQLKTGGKLTLEKVYFTYGNSQKGMLSPYTFTYNNNSTLMYRSYGMDRWGTYKNADKNPNALNNIDFPYTNQSKNETDAYASAWCLTGIQLPSGGEISVKYESDDYAYVEGERASIMLPILGFGKTPNIPIPENYSQNLYDGKNDNNQYIFFRASGVSSEQEFKERYFSPKGGTITEPLFFKFCIDLGDQSNMLRNRNFVENYEYVSGYVDIKRVGWSNGTGWIELPEVSVDDQTKRGATINPIAKEAMQFIRINVPDLFFGGNEETPNDDLVDKFNNFLVNVNDFSSIFRGGQHEAMRAQNFGRYVDTKKSFIRLKAPNCKKLGGGVRVKELKITDGWATMGGQNAENFSYGQTYKYTKTLEAGENGISKDMEISSGVASYEPAIGGEENSLHNTPAKYTEKNRM